MGHWVVITIDQVMRAENPVLDQSISVSEATEQDIKLCFAPDEWNALQEICQREQSSLHAILKAVDATKIAGLSLEAAMRLFIFDYFRAAATEEGHWKAGHGTGMATAISEPHAYH